MFQSAPIFFIFCSIYFTFRVSYCPIQCPVSPISQCQKGSSHVTYIFLLILSLLCNIIRKKGIASLVLISDLHLDSIQYSALLLFFLCENEKADKARKKSTRIRFLLCVMRSLKYTDNYCSAHDCINIKIEARGI